jgi:Flp pilus assembly protein TadG
MRLRQSSTDTGRHGGSAVEFAVLLPFLAFMVVVAVDFARVFRHTQIVTNCARNGALYGSYSPAQASDTNGIRAAALADAGDLPASATVSSTTGTDAAGFEYVSVTVSCPFNTITRYPGVPANMSMTRTVQMRVSTLLPFGKGF